MEDSLYNSPALMSLKSVLENLDELQKLVVTASASSVQNALPPPSGIPNCNVACQRIGTVVPIYACNDDILNCGTCGVDGFYYLGWHGCVILCILHCREFYS